MADRQFVACAFRPHDTRTYTYHNDGPPLVPGDEVKVADKSGEGWRRVYVREVSWTRPAFETKPILGIAAKDEEPPAKGKPEPIPPVSRDLFGEG